MDTAKSFRTLTVVTAVFIFALITVGGIVRVTGSGLGCPDWPLCYGRVLPPAEVTAWIEFSHRVVAGVTGLLILAVSFFIWRDYRHVKPLMIPGVLNVGLLALQVPLGGVIVFTELEPLAVATHLAKAMLIFATSIAIAVMANRPTGAPRPSVKRGYVRLLAAATAAAFLLLMSGALVVGSRASIACPDWPLCQGGIIPPAEANIRAFVHMGHRYVVALVSALLVTVVTVTLRRREQVPGARLWSWALIGLLAGQIVVGAVQVLLVLPPFWRALHLSMASAVWAALVVLSATTLVYGVVERRTEAIAPAAVPTPGK